MAALSDAVAGPSRLRHSAVGRTPRLGVPATTGDEATSYHGRRGESVGGHSARADQPTLVGQDGRLHPVSQSQLGEQGVDVRFDGPGGHAQGDCDLRVGQARGDVEQHFPFAWGELTESAGDGGRRGRALGEGVDEAAGDGRSEDPLAGGDDTEGGQEVLGPGVLEQEAGGSAQLTYVAAWSASWVASAVRKPICTTAISRAEPTAAVRARVATAAERRTATE